MKKIIISIALIATALTISTPGVNAAAYDNLINQKDAATNARIDALEARVAQLERTCAAPANQEMRISALETKVDIIQKNVMAVLSAILSFLGKLVK